MKWRPGLVQAVGLLVALSVSRADKIQAQQQQQVGSNNNEQHPAPEPYSFSYSAESTGGLSTHMERGDGTGKVTGYYTILGQDGRERRVDYVADENGYRATIKTNEVGARSESSADATYETQLPSAKQLEQAKVTAEQYQFLEQTHQIERERHRGKTPRTPANQPQYAQQTRPQWQQQQQQVASRPINSPVSGLNTESIVSGSEDDWRRRAARISAPKQSDVGSAAATDDNNNNNSDLVADLANQTASNYVSRQQTSDNSQEEKSNQFSTQPVKMREIGYQQQLAWRTRSGDQTRRPATVLQRQLEAQFMQQASQLTDQDYPRQTQYTIDANEPDVDGPRPFIINSDGQSSYLNASSLAGQSQPQTQTQRQQQQQAKSQSLLPIVANGDTDGVSNGQQQVNAGQLRTPSQQQDLPTGSQPTNQWPPQFLQQQVSSQTDSGSSSIMNAGQQSNQFQSTSYQHVSSPASAYQPQYPNDGQVSAIQNQGNQREFAGSQQPFIGQQQSNIIGELGDQNDQLVPGGPTIVAGQTNSADSSQDQQRQPAAKPEIMQPPLIQAQQQVTFNDQQQRQQPQQPLRQPPQRANYTYTAISEGTYGGNITSVTPLVQAGLESIKLNDNTLSKMVSTTEDSNDTGDQEVGTRLTQTSQFSGSSYQVSEQKEGVADGHANPNVDARPIFEQPTTKEIPRRPTSVNQIIQSQRQNLQQGLLMHQPQLELGTTFPTMPTSGIITTTELQAPSVITTTEASTPERVYGTVPTRAQERSTSTMAPSTSPSPIYVPITSTITTRSPSVQPAARGVMVNARFQQQKTMVNNKKGVKGGAISRGNSPFNRLRNGTSFSTSQQSGRQFSNSQPSRASQQQQQQSQQAANQRTRVTYQNPVTTQTTSPAPAQTNSTLSDLLSTEILRQQRPAKDSGAAVNQLLKTIGTDRPDFDGYQQQLNANETAVSTPAKRPQQSEVKFTANQIGEAQLQPQFQQQQDTHKGTKGGARNVNKKLFWQQQSQQQIANPASPQPSPLRFSSGGVDYVNSNSFSGFGNRVASSSSSR